MARIMDVSSSQRVVDRAWVWLIAKINDVMQPVTPQARHVEATKREISSPSMPLAL